MTCSKRRFSAEGTRTRGSQARTDFGRFLRCTQGISSFEHSRGKLLPVFSQDASNGTKMVGGLNSPCRSCLRGRGICAFQGNVLVSWKSEGYQSFLSNVHTDVCNAHKKRKEVSGTCPEHCLQSYIRSDLAELGFLSPTWRFVLLRSYQLGVLQDCEAYAPQAAWGLRSSGFRGGYMR